LLITLHLPASVALCGVHYRRRANQPHHPTSGEALRPRRGVVASAWTGRCARSATAVDDQQQPRAALRWLLLRARLRARPRQPRRRSQSAARPPTWARVDWPAFAPRGVFVPNPPGDPESAERRTIAYASKEAPGPRSPRRPEWCSSASP